MNEPSHATPPRPNRWRRATFRAVLVLCGVLAFVWIESERTFGRRYEAADLGAVIDGAVAAGVRPSGSGDSSSVDLPTRDAELARGRHVVTAINQCTFCHGNDLGGQVVADDPWIGRIDSGNLTTGIGGVGRAYDSEDWARALRHGVRSDGTSLLLMPSRGLAELSDADLAAIVAYLEQVPPIDRATRPTRVGWMTRAIVAIGLANDIFSAEEATRAHAARGDNGRAMATGESPRPEASAEYGAYLVALGNCRVCHKADLRGGLHPLALPGEPAPPPIAGEGAMDGWTLTDFAKAMRDGRTPAGRLLDREYMPWPGYAALTDLEIQALWRYLGSVDSPLDVELAGASPAP